MLKKLLKHDFKALSRVLFPLQIGVLAATLLATLLVTVSARLSGSPAGTENATNIGSNVLMGMAVVTAFLVGMAVLASFAATLIVVLARFYKNFLCDEGYLTFTLPVTTAHLLWSKVLTGMLWLVINAAVICVSGLIFVSFGTVTEGVMNLGALELMGSIFSGLGELGEHTNVALATAVCLAYAILGLGAMLLELYFSIIVGGQVAKKNKLLAGIGMFLVINFGVSIFKTLFRVLGWGVGGVGLVLNTAADASSFFNTTMVTGVLLSAVLCAIFFLWSRAILRRNLNLQ